MRCKCQPFLFTSSAALSWAQQSHAKLRDHPVTTDLQFLTAPVDLGYMSKKAIGSEVVQKPLIGFLQ